MKLTLDLICFGIQKNGGISNYWLKLIDFLNRKNFEIEIILPKKSFQTIEDSENVKTLEEKVPALCSRYMPIRQSTKNIIHSSYYRLPLLKQNAVITSLYDFTYEYSETGLKKYIHSCQKNLAIRKSDAVICISESTKNILLNTTNIHEEKIFVTRLGVDKKKFFYEEDLEYKKKFFNTVLFIGSRGGYKRFDLAVKALSHERDLRLGIVGLQISPKEIDFLNRFIPNRWDYLGFVSNENLRKLYSNSFAFIFPSDHEGFGLPILEAMASGCPVVASKKTSFPEIGRTSILYAEDQDSFEYFSKIDLLKSSSEKREIMKKKGFLRAEEFSWDKTFEETLKIYNKFY